MSFVKAEYIWRDGTPGTQELRSKTRIVELGEAEQITPNNFPIWSFDGSSTHQGTGDDSDRLLQPVSVVTDPLRGKGNFLVLCEVLLANHQPHSSNTRSILRNVLDGGGAEHKPWIGFEQEYTLFKDGRPLSWPLNGYPEPQGPYYCGVGADKVAGRELVERHIDACLDAGLLIYGINAEVMPAQWEFQIGYRGVAGEDPGVLNMCDHLCFARWLLSRLGEDEDIAVSFEPKPVKGDWNGAGNHSNFSTAEMRDPKAGAEAIKQAVSRLEARHELHVLLYGEGIEERLTGEHETCHISQFRAGNADRGASIRIPADVAKKGYGYIEDRRPAANIDPYIVAALLTSTVCGMDAPVELKPFQNDRISKYNGSSSFQQAGA